MTYFLVLPLFVMWLLAAVGASAASRIIPQLNHLFPWVWRISLWATLGCAVGNAILLLLLSNADRLGQPFDTGSYADELYKLGVDLAVLIGPMFVSALGWIAGALIGALLAFSRTRRKPGIYF